MRKTAQLLAESEAALAEQLIAVDLAQAAQQTALEAKQTALDDANRKIRKLRAQKSKKPRDDDSDSDAVLPLASTQKAGVLAGYFASMTEKDFVIPLLNALPMYHRELNDLERRVACALFSASALIELLHDSMRTFTDIARKALLNYKATWLADECMVSSGLMSKVLAVLELNPSRRSRDKSVISCEVARLQKVLATQATSPELQDLDKRLVSFAKEEKSARKRMKASQELYATPVDDRQRPPRQERDRSQSPPHNPRPARQPRVKAARPAPRSTQFREAFLAILRDTRHASAQCAMCSFLSLAAPTDGHRGSKCPHQERAVEAHIAANPHA